MVVLGKKRCSKILAPNMSWKGTKMVGRKMVWMKIAGKKMDGWWLLFLMTLTTRTNHDSKAQGESLDQAFSTIDWGTRIAMERVDHDAASENHLS